MVRIAQIGLGAWGKNLLRSFSEVSSVKIVCTTGREENVRWLKNHYPEIEFCIDFNQVLRGSIDAVVIATPIATHFTLAEKALLKGKHVFIEKPLATTTGEAEKLLSLAQENNKLIFVGNIFIYHEVFAKIKEMIKGQKVIKIDGLWEKFGTFDEEILWNLVPHDLAVVFTLLGYSESFHILKKDKDFLSLQLAYTTGEICTLTYNRRAASKDKKIYITTKNKNLLWHNNDLYEITDNVSSLIFTSKKEALVREVQSFLSALKKERIEYETLDLEIVKLLSLIQKDNGE